MPVEIVAPIPKCVPPGFYPLGVFVRLVGIKESEHAPHQRDINDKKQDQHVGGKREA